MTTIMLREYDKRPQKASCIVLDDHETQKPITTRAQNLSFTQEWLDNPDPVRDTEVNVGFPQDLYTTCVNFFKSNLQRIAKKTSVVDKHWLANLNEELGRLHIWGLSFIDGRLVTVLNQSDELRNDILGLLSDISQLLINNLASFLNRDQDQDEDRDRHGQIAELEFLIKRSKAIISSSNESDVEDDESVSSDETNLLQLPDSKSAGDGGTPVIQEDRTPGGYQHTLVPPPASPIWIEGTSVASTRCSDTEDDSSDESITTFESALQCHIDCLMDLIPTLEKSLARVETGQHMKHAARPPFSVSEAALPFVLQVHDKFPTAPTKLIERLGESNWQRYTALRSGSECREEIEETVPHSIFHDSGVGTSIASITQRAISVASHTSFISSRAEGGHMSLRVPPTPPEVSLGKPFICEVCSKTLDTIKNRVEWKLHIFADLQPYICTFESCDNDLTRFPTRKLWLKHDDTHRFDIFWRCPLCREDFDDSSKLGDHLTSSRSCSVTAARLGPIIQAAQHRVPHPIESQSCPLCKITPGKSRRNYTTHVGEHMEDIALAALPHAIEDSSDEASVESIDDHRFSMRDDKPEKEHYQRHDYPPVYPADQNPPCNTLYIGNLPIDTSEDELKAVFLKQRGFKRLCFRTKQNGPMCFVEFEDVSFATKALNELYGQPLHNSVKGGIRLSFSKNPLGVPNKEPSEYGDDGIADQDKSEGGGGFNGADPKKRQGRNAPPGRCHACNRAETSEWRRGPFGARTLCNACGLHYAKLTRNTGSKTSTSRTLNPSESEQSVMTTKNPFQSSDSLDTSEWLPIDHTSTEQSPRVPLGAYRTCKSCLHVNKGPTLDPLPHVEWRCENCQHLLKESYLGLPDPGSESSQQKFRDTSTKAQSQIQQPSQAAISHLFTAATQAQQKEIMDEKERKKDRISNAKKGKKVHVCNYFGCEKVFTRAQHLKRHQGNHSLEPLFRCTIEVCHKSFQRADLLARHLDRQHGSRAKSSPKPIARSSRSLSSSSGTSSLAVSPSHSRKGDDADEGLTMKFNANQTVKLDFKGDSGGGRTIELKQSRDGGRGTIKDPPSLSSSTLIQPPDQTRQHINGHRNIDLRVQLPPTQLFSGFPASTTTVVCTPTSLPSYIAQSPINHTPNNHSPLFTSSYGIDQPSPVKKKLSLNDYMNRRNSHKFDTLGTIMIDKQHLGSSPILPHMLKPSLSLVEESKIQPMDENAMLNTLKVEADGLLNGKPGLQE